MSPSAPTDTSRALMAALALLLLGVGLGLLLRVGQLWPVGLNVGNATHAHSHTLYWGWAGTALFALFFERVRVAGRLSRVVLAALALQGLATPFVFTRWGYEAPGVVLSAATLFPFLGAVGLFFFGVRGQRGGDLPFLRAAVLYVLLAYASAMSRVVLQVRHVDDPFLGDLAVHLFLGTFGAFFVLGVMGLTVRALGGGAPGPLLAVTAGVAAPVLAWPTLLTVPGIEQSPLAGWARLMALVMLVPAVTWSLWVWQRTAARPERWLWRSAAFAWSLGVALLALVALGFFEAFTAARHAIIAVVHLQVLGVVTSSLLLLIELRSAQPRLAALWLHQAGLAVMLTGLGLATLWPSRLGLGLAALGGAGVVVAQAWVAVRYWRGPPPLVSPALLTVTA